MVLLGSTGSIGVNALAIAQRFGLEIEALVAGYNVELLNQQISQFHPKFVAVANQEIAKKVNHDNVLITRKDYPHIDGIPDLISLKPTLLKEVGGYSLLEGIPAKRFETTDMNINNNMKLLINRRIDAFSYPLKVVEYYLKIHPEVVDKVRIYRDFFRKNQQRHTFGFSIFSKYSKIKNNRNFNPFKPVSRTNIPNVLDENSIAYKFSESLNKMYKDGEIENIYKKYRIEEQ